MPDKWSQYAQKPDVQDKWAQYAATPESVPATPEVPTAMDKAVNFGKDVAKGLGQSAVGLMSTGDEWARKHLPAFMTNTGMGFGPPANLEHVKQMATPQNTTQAISKGIGDVAQFLIPGGAEEKAAMMAPKAIRPLARIAAGALSSGLVNKAQGGEFGTGALAGAGGGVVGEGLRAAAPHIAEASLGIRKADRAFGKTLGKAILSETRGIRPETIAESGRDALNTLTPQMEAAAANSPMMANLKPATDVIGDAMDKAYRENAASLHGQLNEMGNHLMQRFGTGQAIPQQVTPSDLLNLKRGFSKEFLGRWNPETHGDTIATGRKAYRALDSELDRTVPEAAELNQRISSLIPVVHRAESVSRNAPTMQRALGRFGAHTGALTLGGIGGAEGYREGGVPGAIAGGLTGVMAPELIASPEGQMIAARLLNKSKTLRPLVGAGLQLTGRRKDIGGQDK
jgi:hypothetical protein